MDKPEGPPQLREDSPNSDLRDLLQFAYRQHHTPQSQWTLYQNPIGFKDGKPKMNWSTVGKEGEMAILHTFNQWIKQRWDGKVLIGFFCTWSQTWVGLVKSDWEKLPWHCWGALYRRKETGGKDLVIWDSNAHSRYQGVASVPYKSLLGMQRNLVDYVKKQGGLGEVYIGGSGNDSRGVCCEVTGRWIMEITTPGSYVETNAAELHAHGFKGLDGWKKG